MDHSILLAQILGPYCAIVGAGIFFNQKSTQQIAVDYATSPLMIYMGGILSLFFGLLVITFHPVWVSDWRVIITVFGWLGLLKGAWLIMFPSTVKHCVSWYQKSTTPLAVQSIILFFIGVYLMFQVYSG